MRIILILLFALLSLQSKAQKLSFCEKADDKGNEINPSSIFYIDPKGGFFNALVKLDRGLESELVIFDLYLLNEQTGKEHFNSSIRMKVNPGCTWFYKEITFFKRGLYHVYVYDQRDRLLAVGKVKVELK